MAKAIGLGGVFLRSRDPEALYAWYAEHLGMTRSEDGTVVFDNVQGDSVQAPGKTVIAFFPVDTEYMGSQDAMLNFRVDDLDGVMQKLVSAGVTVDPKREDCAYGRFGWFTDPEGNRVELWQPNDVLSETRP